MNKSTIYVYAKVQNGSHDYTFCTPWTQTESVDTESGAAYVLLRQVEIDTSIPEGMDPVKEAVAMYEEGMEKAREKYLKTKQLFEQQLSWCLALPAPGVVDGEVTFIKD